MTYTETAAALARAVRMELLSDDAARAAWRQFQADWPGYTRLKLSTALVERAAALAWDFGLRGYDATHLASALLWQEALGEPVNLAAFDRALWNAAPAGRPAGVAAGCIRPSGVNWPPLSLRGE